MKRAVFAAALACWLALYCAPSTRAQQRPAQRAAKKKDDPFLRGPAFSFDDLLRLVGNVYEGRLKEAIERRGVAFSPSPTQLNALKNAGASAELTALILSKAPAPPKAATAPAPPPSGAVVVECAPAECAISVNGVAKGQTRNGALEISHLPPGPAVIDFKKAGYETEQATVVVKAGARVTSSATLNPTLATQQEIGKSIFARMRERLGGNAGLAEVAALTAAGNATLWPAGGQRTDWQITGRLKLPASLAYLEISGAGLNWWVSLKGSDAKRGGSGKLKGSPVALEMEKLIRLYRDYQLAALVGRIEAENMKLLAVSANPDSGGKIGLRAVGQPDSFRFSLAADGTPEKVTYESASGLGSGLEVVYGEYVKVGNAAYPRSMAIRFADQAQHGMQLRFEEVKSAPKLTDREFRR